MLYTAWYRGTTKDDPATGTGSIYVQMGRDDENKDPDKVTTVVTTNIADTKLNISKEWFDKEKQKINTSAETKAKVTIEGKEYTIDKVQYVLKVTVNNANGTGESTSGYYNGKDSSGRVQLAANKNGAQKYDLTEGSSHDWSAQLSELPSGAFIDFGTGANPRYVVESYEYEVEEFKVFASGNGETNKDVTAYFEKTVAHDIQSSQTTPVTWTMTNKETDELTGSLIITKNVTVNGHETTTNLADGTYEFTIHNDADAENTANDKTVKITVTDGVAASAEGGDFDPTTKAVTVSDLAAGDYTITETEVSGMTTAVSGGKDNKDNEDARSITVTVTAGETVAAEAQATFTNNKPYLTYSPKVTKTLTGRDWKEGDSFTFTLAQPTEQTGVTMPDNSTVTVTNRTAASFDAVTFTAAGTYSFTVTETVPIDASNGTVTWENADDTQKAAGGFVKNGITYDGSAHTITVNVAEANGVLSITHINGSEVTEQAAIEAVTTTIVNTYDVDTPVVINGTKSMKGGETPDTYSFTLTADTGTPMPAGATTSGTNQTVTVQNSGSDISFGTITYRLTDMTDATQVEGSTSKTEKTFTYTVTEVDESSTHDNIHYDPAVYTVSVTVTYDSSTGTLTAKGPTYSKQIGSDEQTSAEGITFENEKVTTVTVTKAWKKADGTAVTPPAGTKIVLDLYKTSVTEVNKVNDASITLDGELEDTEAYPTGNGVDNRETEAWKATWSNLPKYEGGEHITYVVKEAEPITSGYTVSYSNDGYALTGETITNTLNETSLKIVKVDSNDQQALTGAVFSLEKRIADGTAWSAVENYATFTVNNTEGFTLTGLTDGNYRLSETQAPAGYIALTQAIEFTVANGEVNDPGTVTYTAARTAVAADPENNIEAQAAVPAVFTIGNTPGVELPSTGGPGTVLYTAAGLSLLLGASLWLILRRRKEQQD